MTDITGELVPDRPGRDDRGQFLPGVVQTPSRGRPKGSENKLNGMVRAALCEAFERKGGVDYLCRLADEHPAVFVALLSKALPRDGLQGAISDDQRFHVTVEYV